MAPGSVEATSDDLTKPLGVGERHRRPSRIGLYAGRVATGALLLLLAAGAVLVAVRDDPLGGEPHAVVVIERGVNSRSVEESRPQTPKPEEARRDARAVEGASGVAVVRPEGASAPGSLVITVPAEPNAALHPAPDSRLVERGRYGLLPRIGPDGLTAAALYARPVDARPAGGRPPPRVAVLVGGLGIGQAATADAIAKLPPEVTLAFAPYGSDLSRSVSGAREDGHEVMLQVPMEPFDYPDSDPGPHTLLAKAKSEDNLDRLHWVMGRFSGYTGLVTFMGAKLTADEAALIPILREAKARGLLFLDDGSSSRSLVAAVGPGLQARTARAEIVLDGVPRADAIDRELARLEEVARERGVAIASASALPLTVERLARWSKDLPSRGISLVPVSAAFGQGPRR